VLTGVRHLRAKYRRDPVLERPSSVDQQRWAIFTAYVYRSRTLGDIGKNTRWAPPELRRVIREVDTEIEISRNGLPQWQPITLDSPLEDLRLSVRARNGLHRLGCRNVRDVLALDLAGPVRQIGNKTKAEVLAALKSAGFRGPNNDAAPPSEVRRLSRSLERMQLRVNGALRTVAREISLLQQRLRKKLPPTKRPAPRSLKRS